MSVSYKTTPVLVESLVEQKPH